MRIAIVNTHMCRRIGGSQLQCDTIARELLSRGHDVHYVAVKSAGVDCPAPYVIHSVDYSAETIGRTCIDIEPDIVYWRHNKKCFYRAARMIAAKGIPLVFAVSHVADTRKWVTKASFTSVRPGLWPRSFKSMMLSRWNYRGFKFVDGVVVNNSEHLALIPVDRQVHIDNSLGPQAVTGSTLFEHRKPFCLWVANLKPQKQPEKFVELARRLQSTGVEFIMVGQMQSPQYEYLKDPQNWPENFRYLGPLELSAVNALLSQCTLLVHTCLPEGFPNIFIQAWTVGKPVVSLSFDPDGVLSTGEIGAFCGTFDRMVMQVGELLADPVQRETMGERAREFATARFDSKLNAAKLESFLIEIARLRSPGPGRSDASTSAYH